LLEEETGERLTEADQSSQVGKGSGYRFLPYHEQAGSNPKVRFDDDPGAIRKASWFGFVSSR